MRSAYLFFLTLLLISTVTGPAFRGPLTVKGAQPPADSTSAPIAFSASSRGAAERWRICSSPSKRTGVSDKAARAVARYRVVPELPTSMVPVVGFGREPKPCTTQSEPSSRTSAPRNSTALRQLNESRLTRGRRRRLSPSAKAAIRRALMVWDLDAGMGILPLTFGGSLPGSRPVTLRIIFVG